MTPAPATPTGTDAIPTPVSPGALAIPSRLTPSRRAGSRRRQTFYGAVMLVLVLVVGVTASAWRSADVAQALPPVMLAPAVVFATLRLEGAIVRGEGRDWALNRKSALGYGVPVPVALTAYCLKGLTRRDNYVRQGIVASDPRMFPLARYLEVYVGRNYFGRFLIDDTGGKIKGNRLDIWTPTCAEARRFGWQRGTAVLVPRPRAGRADTLMTGRLGGVAVVGGP
ncbi:MAG: 3D domain-containing protein [Gemmatimonadota bacterium]|nr:3D domain-containing protein [Gemmatimonadota bacterium]